MVFLQVLEGRNHILCFVPRADKNFAQFCTAGYSLDLSPKMPWSGFGVIPTEVAHWEMLPKLQVRVSRRARISSAHPVPAKPAAQHFWIPELEQVGKEKTPKVALYYISI